MPGTLAKPNSPVWQPGRAPTACDLYLPMTEGSGLVSRDFGSKRLSAQFGISGSNLPAWGKSPYGPAVTFDGSSSVMAMSVTEAALTGTSQLSFLALIYPTSNATFHTIGAKRNAGVASWQMRIGNISGDGFLSYVYSKPSSGFTNFGSGPSPPLNAWSVVGFGYTWPVGSVDYWMAGVKTTTTGTLNLGTPDDAACPVTIGRRFDNAHPFAGQIAAVVRAPVVWSDSTFQSLSADLLAGRLSAVRPRSSTALFAFGTGTRYPYMLMDNSLSGGFTPMGL